MIRVFAGGLSAVVFSLFSFLCYDYISQGVMAGKSPGEFTMADWVQSFADRGRSAARRAELAAMRDGPLRDYLPGAPPGWQRAEWTPEYFDQLRNAKPREISAEEQELRAAVSQETSFKVANAMNTAAGAVKDFKEARRAWVYLRGDQMVILKVSEADLGMRERARRMAGVLGMGQARDLDERPIVALHRGAAFHALESVRSDRTYRSMKAALGTGEIEILVRTNAPEKELKKLLRRINYSALYALMGDDVETAAMERHNALAARLKKDRFDRQMAAADDRAAIDRRLAAAVMRARGTSVNEVCIDYRRKEYCAWVQ